MMLKETKIYYFFFYQIFWQETLEIKSKWNWIKNHVHSYCTPYSIVNIVQSYCKNQDKAKQRSGFSCWRDENNTFRMLVSFRLFEFSACRKVYRRQKKKKMKEIKESKFESRATCSCFSFFIKKKIRFFFFQYLYLFFPYYSQLRH